MLKFYLLLVVCVCIPFAFSWGGLILGTGRWLVLNVGPCDNPEQYEPEINVSRKKINRTHDCFDMHTRVVASLLTVEIAIYQLVDGGFKYFQTMADDDACAYIMKYARDNVVRALTMANIDPPDCPVRPGPLEFTNFVMDYKQLPIHGVYGTFEAVIRLYTKEQNAGCFKITLNFDERNEDDSDEYDDDTDIHKIL